MTDLVACHECDMLFHRDEIPVGAKANCTRCGAELYRHIDNSLDRSLALYLSTFVFMIIANFYPFITMQTAGIKATSIVASGGLALYQFGMGELGFVVFLTSILLPFVCVVSMIYLLVPARFGKLPPLYGPVYRIVRMCEPWSLLAVFMLGTLIAAVKLQDLASVIPGLGMLGFVLMLVTYSAARSNFDPEVLWSSCRVKQLDADEFPGGEEDARVISCHTCGLLRPHHPDLLECERCGATVHFRVTDSLQKTWALLIAASIMLIPANLYPVMSVKKLGKGSADTIVSGVIHLMEAGLFGLAFIVLFASVVVPLMKLTVLTFLLYSVGNQSDWRPRDRTLLYRVTEVVGAWSMVDVFLVGLLSGLVSLGLLASIEPGIGVTFFGAAVILTMLAAHSFDPRLIWDNTTLSSEGMPPEQLHDNEPSAGR
ncbi:MAG: paraquat-inducible protein A [Patiriisocius sp.]